MTKKESVIISASFCAFIGAVALLTALLPKREFSDVENRYLARAPKLTAKTVFSGDFTADAEEYFSDHIAGRDMWVRLKSGAERASGKRENNGVYFAADGTLINRVDEPKREKLEKNAGFVAALAEKTDVPVTFALIPTAAETWCDKLPAGAPTADEKMYIAAAYEYFNAALAANENGTNSGKNAANSGENGAKIDESGTNADAAADVLAALAEHSGEPVFYRTDHHWTSLGAYYGANAVLDAMGHERLDLADYEKEVVSDSFYGTAWSSAGAPDVPPDTMERYVSDDGVTVTSWFDDAPEQGKLYHEENLAKKDKYSYFLGGNQPLCVISSERASTGEKLLVIRDSYCDEMAPFLAERFAEIHLFDLRYNRMSVGDYIRENGIDRVLVIYGLQTFADSSDLVFLSRN